MSKLSTTTRTLATPNRVTAHPGEVFSIFSCSDLSLERSAFVANRKSAGAATSFA